MSKLDTMTLFSILASLKNEHDLSNIDFYTIVMVSYNDTTKRGAILLDNESTQSMVRVDIDLINDSKARVVVSGSFNNESLRTAFIKYATDELAMVVYKLKIKCMRKRKTRPVH